MQIAAPNRPKNKRLNSLFPVKIPFQLFAVLNNPPDKCYTNQAPLHTLRLNLFEHLLNIYFTYGYK